MPKIRASAGVCTLCALVVSLMLASGRSAADYEPRRLHELFAGADVVVIGKIVEVRDDIFRLTVSRRFRSVALEAQIEVTRFVDWTGNARWVEYQVGQTVLLFLMHQQADGGDELQILGAGGEGEMPIEGGHLYCHGTFLAGFPRQRYPVQGGELDGYQFEADVFFSALEDYRLCFQLKGQNLQRPQALVRACTDEQLEAYRSQSALHRYLTESSLENIARFQN